MSCADSKSLLRQDMLRLRSALPEEIHHLKSEEISRRTVEFIRAVSLRDDSIVLIYMPLHPEVDSRPVIEWLWREGIRTAAPVIRRNPRNLEWRLITSDADLQLGVWGIREPKPSCPPVEDMGQVSLILIPGLAFDPSGGRLGYGGGYYDRFLEKMPKNKNTEHIRSPKLAMAFDFQVVPQIPMDEHDIFIDLVITEKHIYHSSQA
ncbi:MAG: 5-formyltetrahydrofolate cyclo-ligase [Gorillibacterium sp.]|nr:5-formyltetrahydrofolate cyclo-ligase [Gorillibacterium sp.]